jgi:multiple antibiotic resistance protein
MFIEMLLLSVSQPLSLPVSVIRYNFFENLIKSTIALFVVIDPVGNVPLFIALTEKMEKNERKAVSKIAIITAAILLTVFAIAGSEILTIFGITIYSFMVAGGILLFIVSIELLTHGT